MCGIVGYVGSRPCRELLVAGLEKLEYRGYDSAGVSVISDGRIETIRAVGNLSNLRAAVEAASNGGAVAVAERPPTTGVAHTRWATHGRVTEENAHPHSDCTDRIHIVLNGIVENHAALRRQLQDEGHRFSSETDAEIVAHLIERNYEGDITEAVRVSFGELRGHYAFVAACADQPGAAGRRPQGVPADRRDRRGRDLPRLGDPGLPGGDQAGDDDRQRRDRHRRCLRDQHH